MFEVAAQVRPQESIPCRALPLSLMRIRGPGLERSPATRWIILLASAFPLPKITNCGRRAMVIDFSEPCEKRRCISCLTPF